MDIFLNVFSTSWIFNGFMQLMLALDGIIYMVLQGAVEVFFMIGGMNFNALTDDLVNIISSFKSLVGIYILFKASLLLIQYLIDPEKFKDKSQGGAAFIKNLVITIVLIILLESNILFGTLNDIQKIIFCNGDSCEFEVLDDIGVTSSTEKKDVIRTMVFGESESNYPAHELTVTILSQFLYTNDGNHDWYSYGAKMSGLRMDASSILYLIATDGKDPDSTSTDENGPAGISFMMLPCMASILSDTAQIEYFYILSGIFGIYMIIKFFKYGMQLVIRFLKLVLMQILAPIAIVSYVTPSGQSTFKNFWKTYFTIFFELFIRLLVIYIMVYLMGLILSNESELGGEGLIFKIILLVAINKFADEMPGIISSLFGGKLDDKQKSMGGILGGILGGGIGAAVGIGAAGAAGAGIGGSLLGGALGMFGGGKAGANSQNVGAFVSGQVSNATKATGRGMTIADSGGMGAYIQMQADKNFGGANGLKTKAARLKMNADNASKSNSLFSAINDEKTKSYLKHNIGQGATESDYYSAKMGATEDMVTEGIRQNGKFSLNLADGSSKEITTMDQYYQERGKWNNKLKADSDKDFARQVQSGRFDEDSLKQAYENFNTHEEIAANLEKREKRTIDITTDSVGNPQSTNLKALSDANKTEAATRQRTYDAYVSTQRYKNIS